MIQGDDGCIKEFGASNTDAPSHFFYFRDGLYCRREYFDLLLDTGMMGT